MSTGALLKTVDPLLTDDPALIHDRMKTSGTRANVVQV